MKRKRYTYIPKDEIAEVRTFNDVSFESDDLLDGAYVKGRKKFARGGMPSKRPMSLEEQAAESVGYDTYFMMDAVDQKELVDELLSTGMISYMFRGGMTQYGKGGMTAKKAKDIFEEYQENEDNNYHSENVVLLAKHFGSASDLKSAKMIQSKHNSIGYLTNDLREERDALSDKLYPKLIEAKNKMADGAVVDYDQWEMVVISKGLEKDGGQYLKGRYLVSAKDIEEAKKIATELWKKEMWNSDFYIVKVMSDSLYRLKYMDVYADGGMADGGYVAVSEKDGYLFIISKPTTKQKAQQQIDLGGIPKGEKAKVISVEDAKAHKKVIGREYLADGGTIGSDMKQSTINEAVKIALFAYDNGISASVKTLEQFSREIFELSGISYAKAYLELAYQSMKNQGYADGGVTGSTYTVKYSMKDTPEIVKEKVFLDKDSAELFYEAISDDEDLVVMDLQEVKVAPAPKKSLFATAKPAPVTAASKKKRERVEVDGISDEIARYDELKATINNAKAEQEVIGGMLKEIGREKFLDLYEQRGVRPANFDLADGSENILLEILDKYLKVEPEKAELLRQFDGLLEEKTSYEFDSELLEKEVSEGMTIGDVVSMLIQDSKLIPDGDKANLIKAKMTMRVPKGTIDRLMDYDNPREIFSLISPILALK